MQKPKEEHRPGCGYDRSYAATSEGEGETMKSESVVGEIREKPARPAGPDAPRDVEISSPEIAVGDDMPWCELGAYQSGGLRGTPRSSASLGAEQGDGEQPRRPHRVKDGTARESIPIPSSRRFGRKIRPAR
jgi:hypothetical protein